MVTPYLRCGKCGREYPNNGQAHVCYVNTNTFVTTTCLSDGSRQDALRKENANLRAQLAALQAENKRLVKSIEDLTPGGSEFHDDPTRCLQFIGKRMGAAGQIAKERNELRAENKRLREVIGMVEFIDDKYWDSKYCPWCKGEYHHMKRMVLHKPGCPRQEALKEEG